MRNRIKLSLFTFLLCIGTLAGCGKSKPKEKEFKFDDIELVDNPIEIEDNSYYYCNQIYDVETNFVLYVGSSNLVSNSNLVNITPMISLVDDCGEPVIYNVLVSSIEGVDYFAIGAPDVLKPGRTYQVDLLADELYFKDKDPTMDTLYFNVKKDDTDRRIVSDKVIYVDESKIISYPNFDDRFAPSDPKSDEAIQYFNTHEYEFLYKEDLSKSLKNGDLFYVANKNDGKWDFDFNSFPGRFVSCVYDKDAKNYRVFMTHADLTQVYDDGLEGTKDFEVYKTFSPTTFTDVKNIFDRNQVINDLKNDTKFVRQVDTINEVLDGTSTAMDIISRISFDFDFEVDAPKVSFQVKAGVLFPVSEHAQVKIQFIYQYVIEFRCSAGVEVETFLGIPYWIHANGDVTKVTDHTFTANIIYMYQWSDQKREEAASKSMQEVILGALWGLEDDPDYFKKGGDSSVKQNTKTVPLLQFNVPFWICNFHIGLDFSLTIDFNVMIGYTYKSHSVQKITTLSTDDGVQCNANQISDEQTYHQLSFVGEIGIKAGLVVTLDLEVAGLRGILDIGVSATIGAYFDIKGGLVLNWDSTGQGMQSTFTAHFELGIYASGTAFMDVIFFHPKYTFANEKWPLFSIGNPFSVARLLAPDEYTLTEKETDLDRTELLNAKIFDSNKFRYDYQTFRLNQDFELNSFCEPSKRVYPLSMTTNSEFLTIDKDNNKIIVNDNTPAKFDAEVVIHINPDIALDSGMELDKKVTIHFQSSDVYTFSFRDRTAKETIFEIPVYKNSVVILPLYRRDTSLGALEYRIGDVGYKNNDYRVLTMTLYYNDRLTVFTGTYLLDNGSLHTYNEQITVDRDMYFYASVSAA